MKAPAAFDVANGVATASHRTIEGLLTRRSPWAREIQALQVNSWATRLVFLEELLASYDEHVDLKADGTYASLDDLADAFGKASHMIGHSSLLISMDRVHHLLHPPPAGVPPDGLRYIELLTGDMLAGAVGDVGVAADFRSASCFAFGAHDLSTEHLELCERYARRTSQRRRGEPPQKRSRLDDGVVSVQ